MYVGSFNTGSYEFPQTTIWDGYLKPNPRMFSLGANFAVCDYARFYLWPYDSQTEPYERVIFEAGDDVWISHGFEATINDKLTIGAKTIIGAHVLITGGNHIFDSRDIPIKDQGYVGEDLRIGSGVWIGSNVSILKGAHVGEGTIIGTGSVLTKPTGDFEIWGGNPAVKIQDRP